MRNSLILAISFLLAACSSPAYGLVDWEKERALGIRQEFLKKNSLALPHYQKALAALPSSMISERIELQCQVAICLLRAEKRVQALPLIEAMLTDAKSLRRTKALTADNEMYLRALIEEAETNHSKLARTNQAEWQEYNKLGVHIRQAVLPDTLTPDFISDRARCFLAVSDRPSALRFLSTWSKTVSTNAPGRLEMDIREAALRNFLGQTEPLKAVKNRLKGRSSADIACMVANAQIWATDYSAANKTLVDTYEQLLKRRALTESDRVNLLFTRVANYCDCGQWLECEKLARQLLTLHMPDRVRERVQDSLAACLERQGKIAESQSIRKKLRSSRFDFLEDDEREASAETARRRGHK